MDCALSTDALLRTTAGVLPLQREDVFGGVPGMSNGGELADRRRLYLIWLEPESRRGNGAPKLSAITLGGGRGARSR